MAEQRIKLRLLRRADGGPHDASGSFVVSYDPHYHLPDGQYDGGYLITTRDPNAATLFTLAEAFNLWRSGPVCECHHLRPDGEPNRPLSAFNVEMT